MASSCLSIATISKSVFFPSTSSSSCPTSASSSSSTCCRGGLGVTPIFVPRRTLMIINPSNRRHVVRMAPDEEKLTRRNQGVGEALALGNRPDIFPQFSPMKTPLPPPMPYDPPEEDEEKEEEEDPEKEEQDKPEN